MYISLSKNILNLRTFKNHKFNKLLLNEINYELTLLLVQVKCDFLVTW